MIVDSAIRSFITATAFAMTLCGQVYALTVYDVIKLSSKDYHSQDIVTLIEVTDSTFALKAEDIPRLMELGVSETVIQTMLKAKHVETQPASPTNPSKPKAKSPVISDHIDAVDDHSHATNKDAKPVVVASVYNASNNTIARKRFNVEPFAEVASGGHHHSAITLSGIKLFVFRDEGQYSSINARGKAVVYRLEEAVSFGRGMFQSVRIAGKNAVMFSDGRGTRPVLIIAVSDKDAYTYQRRSGRQVTPELLAAYWSALLSDYWSIVIIDESPARLTNLHEGEALQALYEGLAAPGAGNRSELVRILQSLPHPQQKQLLRLATGVPLGFNTRSPAQAKHP